VGTAFRIAIEMQEPYSEVTEDYELWSCNDEDSTESEVIALLGSLVSSTKPRVCVEVGAHIGLSSLAIGRALVGNGRGDLHCFEANAESARITEERTAGLPVTVHPMVDADFDPADLPGPVDFLFIDGDLDNRGDSLLHWRPWLSANHVVVVHDSLKHWEVRAAIDATECLQRIDLVTPRGLTLMRLS
jgi:predicted O-methyltransferase YrrM